MGLLFEWDPGEGAWQSGQAWRLVRRVEHNGCAMKKMRYDPDMLEEYDFGRGVRGKYAKRYAEGANVVVIDPDVSEYFPDHESVNESLRSLIAIIKKRKKSRRRSRP